MNPDAGPDAPGSTDARGPHRFGRFRLLALAGKSRRTMAWRVQPWAGGPPLLLVLPRELPGSAEQLHAWQAAVRRTGRLKHPRLAVPVEVDSVGARPYAVYALGELQTLVERLRGAELPPAGAAHLVAAAAEALAGLHDGGLAHEDLQPYLLLVGNADELRLAGAAAAPAAVADGPQAMLTHADALQLPAQRAAARDDVLALGLLLHRLLAGEAALGDDDIGRQIERLPPRGRETVRLPWNSSRPIPEALRAIANRATDRQPRQRYPSARSLQRALLGWLRADGDAGGGPIALVLDRLHAIGTLPAEPGAAERVLRLTLMDRERTHELAAVVLQDLALSFELLRWVNSAKLRELQVAGHGPVLTVRRAIALIGLEGVRRAATGLRDWPGPLAPDAARVLQRTITRARRAAGWARALRPAGFDAEVVGLLALLQNLGRMVAAYHLPDDLQQIQRLMRAEHAADGALQPGMDEQAASFAVLGCDLEMLGIAVARHWGFDDAVLTMLRRLPLGTVPRSADGDEALLRVVASCANECDEAIELPRARWRPALRRVAQRYARLLKITARDLERLVGLPPSPGATAEDGRADETPSADGGNIEAGAT
jgi:non-specific serine/threonine protein kinase